MRLQTSPSLGPLSPTERAYGMAWASLTALTAAECWRLWSHCGTLEAAWQAAAHTLGQAGLSPGTVAAITTQRPTINVATIGERTARAGVSVAAITDQAYPPRLKQIHDPPLVLFYRGQLAGPDVSLAIVGTRRASDYGRQVAWELSRELAGLGVTIVSGLALGIDTEAHRGALAAGGRTLAVLGGGVDAASLYPPANRPLAESILQHGAVLSEFPPGTAPLPFRFPQRNRVIAGITLGTLVVEAPVKSGAMITAKIAAEQNREVMVVPGRITDPTAAGTNALLAQGAMVVRSAADVIEALGLELQRPPASGSTEVRDAPPGSPEAAVLGHLGQPTSREALARLTQLPAAALSVALTRLEVQGLIRRLESGKLLRTQGNRKLAP